MERVWILKEIVLKGLKLFVSSLIYYILTAIFPSSPLLEVSPYISLLP